jgi:hypothetical protein
MSRKVVEENFYGDTVGTEIEVVKVKKVKKGKK